MEQKKLLQLKLHRFLKIPRELLVRYNDGGGVKIFLVFREMEDNDPNDPNESNAHHIVLEFLGYTSNDQIFIQEILEKDVQRLRRVPFHNDTFGIIIRDNNRNPLHSLLVETGALRDWYLAPKPYEPEGVPQRHVSYTLSDSREESAVFSTTIHPSPPAN